jgi:N-acetyl sugar amidotransferase
MEYCRRCVYPINHPLGIVLDEDGICSGCRVHEEKYESNWPEKKIEFENLLSQYRSKSNFHYDCIIPVTGVGDDFFVVDTIKNEFNMNPLLVTYNNHYNTKVGVRNLARLVTKLDCDHIVSTVGPDTIKAITKLTLKEFGDIYWHILAGTQTFPVQVATKLKIPLIIWGVNGWLDQVGMFSHYDQVEMTKKVRKEHALRKMDAETLIGKDKFITKKDLQAFTYPSDAQLESNRVRGLYLGNYIFWDSQKQIEEMINKYGYETKREERTFNTYESINCWNNAGVHDYIKYLKYGYGKVSDHVSRDIRLKRISREEGIKLITKYQDVKPKGLKKFLNYLEIHEKEFFDYIEPHRDRDIWKKDSGKWILSDHIKNHRKDEGVIEAQLEITDKRDYLETDLLEKENINDDYILLGRGYIDETNYKAIEG